LQCQRRNPARYASGCSPDWAIDADHVRGMLDSGGENLPAFAAARAWGGGRLGAILAADLDLARNLVRRADMPVLFEDTTLVMSGSDHPHPAQTTHWVPGRNSNQDRLVGHDQFSGQLQA
jgi:hypothetical protein